LLHQWTKNVQSNNHQTDFEALLQKSGITQVRAAEYIAEQTMRACSDRTVRAWLADPKLPSARPCPEWAVTVLKAKLRS
jgi:hypothetical protein